MLSTINSKKYSHITKPAVLILVVSLFLQITVQPALSAMQFDGTKLFKDINLSVFDFDSTDSLSDEIAEVKIAIDNEFSSEPALEYKFGFKLSGRNTDVFIVPINVIDGLFYFILKDGKQILFYLPLQNYNSALTFDEQSLNLLNTVTDSDSRPFFSSVKDAPSLLSFLKEMSNFIKPQAYFETYDSIPCTCPPGMLPGGCRSICNGGGGGGGGGGLVTDVLNCSGICIVIFYLPLLGFQGEEDYVLFLLNPFLYPIRIVLNLYNDYLENNYPDMTNDERGNKLVELFIKLYLLSFGICVSLEVYDCLTQ